MVEKIKAIFILEILGKPAEHVKKTLAEIVGNLEKEKEVQVFRKKIAEPKKFEQDKNIEIAQEIYTSFAEIEVETTIEKLMMLIFDYMPSHIEVIEPETVKIKNFDLNSFFNELVRRLHQYDELAKAMIIERQNLAKQLQEAIKQGKLKIELQNAKPKKTKTRKNKTNKKS